jgi:putative heme-binding domain-containing protein
MRLVLLAFMALAALPHAAWADTTPQWIWLDTEAAGQEAYFLTEFTVDGEIQSATVAGAADNEVMVFVNGTRVLRNSDWGTVNVAPAKGSLKSGKNVIGAYARNSEGAAGLFVRLTVILQDGKEAVLVSDGSWKAAAEAPKEWNTVDFDASAWGTATPKGAVGDPAVTWTSKVTLASLDQAEALDLDPTPAAQAVTDLNLLPGFKAELLYTVPKTVQGSWVNMTQAPDGGFFVSDQDDAGLYHVKPATLGDPESETVVTSIPAPISSAQGMLWAFDALYVHVNSGGKSGLYRVSDSDGDGTLDKSDLLAPVPGGGEHGPHATILSEDGKSLYIAAGNHTDLPEISGSRLPTNWGEDHLLPRQWDAGGHAVGRLAPGGWIAKVTPDGKNWEIISSGYRNQYDIDLNTEGELFTYDADMEWDFGSPWYRPTRVNHAVSGSEYGWRSGTGKWPTYYEDSLPPVVDIGPGSPTGVTFGTDAKFPAKYQQAFYILDWTFGTIYAIHMTPTGASYVGEKEEFISGTPLAVTDAIIGPDGAFYFTVGGRGTQAALYRVYYDGPESTEATTRLEAQETIDARAQRHALEAFHGNQDPAAVEAAWPYLGNADRFLRYAARVAIENQPVAEWQERALSEKDPQAAAVALIALARQGDPAVQPQLLEALARFDLAKLEETPALGLLRAYALCFIRMGRPDQPLIDAAVAQLNPLLPAKSDALNSELLQLLVYLDAPGVVDKGMALIADKRPDAIPDWAELLKRNQGYGGTIQKMLDNHPPTRSIGYAFILRNARHGWTLPQREAYFTFLNDAAKFPGGASFPGFLTNMRDDALTTCSDEERMALAEITGKSLQAVPDFEIRTPEPAATPWTLESAVAAVKNRGLSKRSFEAGRNNFYAVGCAVCHRFDGAGGAVGPDLSTVANKFSTTDLLEAIIDPNKVISDQYGSSIVTLEDGTEYQGIVIDHSGSKEEGEIQIWTSDIKAEPILVKTKDVVSVERSRISQMPQDMANFMNEDELLDLLAYLMSRGNPDANMFK